MSAQSSLNAITGSVIGGALAIGKMTEGLDKFGLDSEPEKQNVKKSSGIDAKMAQKARKQMQAKINAIYANKEISNKARTRRVGKVLDEYQGGGN